jgi:hypothetical protein
MDGCKVGSQQKLLQAANILQPAVFLLWQSISGFEVG